ncbi:hypothetical protein CEXT_211561 [Caerostris extrusa]|uniref:Uncharacterized protein n=1 Tax=Caerostris extrusa TaxID=172846 RepID=A0AAV4X001_CAEEX|nr:hypothetical protein CEXT_211561 [Caerostris extrusa]
MPHSGTTKLHVSMHIQIPQNYMFPCPLKYLEATCFHATLKYHEPCKAASEKFPRPFITIRSFTATHFRATASHAKLLWRNLHTPCSLHPHANVPRPCPSTTSIFNSRHWTLPAIDPALPPPPRVTFPPPPPIDPRLPLSSLFLPLMIPLLLSILHGILICIFSLPNNSRNTERMGECRTSVRLVLQEVLNGGNFQRRGKSGSKWVRAGELHRSRLLEIRDPRF